MENKIDYQDYQDNYKRYFKSLNYQEMIDIIEYLKGKSTSNEFEDIDDCSVDLVSDLLRMDSGRSIVIKYSKDQKRFFKSNYLSNYFKESIKEMLGESLSQELQTILNSDKDINDMTEDEIKIITDSIEEYYKINGKSPKSNISSRFTHYLYKLDGKGIISYIKNNIHPSELARQILLTSGLNPRASYYSGRGVNYGDLSDKNLVEIYRKLLKIDKNYAINFTNLVDNMRTLGATEFIESFINFGYSNFEYQDPSIITNSNVSLDGLEGNASYLVGAISLFEHSRRNENYQISESEQMKAAFFYKINYINEKLLNNEEITEKDLEILDKYDNCYFRFLEYSDKPMIRRRRR